MSDEEEDDDEDITLNQSPNLSIVAEPSFSTKPASLVTLEQSKSPSRSAAGCPAATSTGSQMPPVPEKRTSVSPAANNPTPSNSASISRKPPSLMSLDLSKSPSRSTAGRQLATSAACGMPPMPERGAPVSPAANNPVLGKSEPVGPAASYSPIPLFLSTGSVGPTADNPRSGPVVPPGFQQPFQPHSGVLAFGCGTPYPGADLAQMESLLRENPLLTDQVKLLISQQYPLYAANHLTLQFLVYNELLQLKKFRQQQSAQTSASGHSRPTAGVESSTRRGSGGGFSESGTEFSQNGKFSQSSSAMAGNSSVRHAVGDVESCTRRDGSSDFPESGGAEFSQRGSGMPDGRFSQASSMMAGNSDVRMKMPEVAASANISHPPQSAWTGSSGFPESGAEFSQRGSGMPDGRFTQASSTMAGNSDVRMKMPVAAASANIPHPPQSAWTGSAISDRINPWYSRSPVSKASARPRPAANSSSHVASGGAVKRDSGTDVSGSGTDLSERGSSVAEIKSSSASPVMVESGCNNGLKRPVAVAATARDSKNPWHTPQSEESRRPRGNASLDSLADITPVPPSGILADL